MSPQINAIKDKTTANCHHILLHTHDDLTEQLYKLPKDSVIKYAGTTAYHPAKDIRDKYETTDKKFIISYEKQT
jgi:hypothetical protein